MSLRLFNSLTRQMETFTPRDPQRVTMYVCGPTVYNYIHIGNARPPVVFGVLAQLLRARYPKVVYARNITDVDDKINAAACEQAVPISAITERFTAAYRDNMAALGVSPAAPDVMLGSMAAVLLPGVQPTARRTPISRARCSTEKTKSIPVSAAPHEGT